MALLQAHCYHIDQFESLRPVFMRVIEYANAMGLDMIQATMRTRQVGSSSISPTTMRCARPTAWRPTARFAPQVAREFDLIACFMTKPFMGVSANGCHTNISLWSGGQDKVNVLGNKEWPAWSTVFSLPQRRHQSLHARIVRCIRRTGPVGLNCVGGVIEHLPALTAIGCSTVNSYRRLSDQGFWAPVYADSGYQNRTCGLRVRRRAGSSTARSTAW